MRHQKRVAGVVVALVMTFGTVAAGIAESRRAARCYALQVNTPRPDRDVSTSDRRVVRSRNRRPAFSARDVLDLEFEAWMSSRGGLAKEVQFKVFTPNGHLYQTLKMPFTAPTVEEQDARARRRRRRMYHAVRAKLPVAGTSIVSSSLYGKWRLEAYMDGQTMPCARPLKFSIEP